VKQLFAILGLLLITSCSSPFIEPQHTETWINPGKVIIDNFRPGAEAEYLITIHNGKPEPAQFKVSYRNPDHVGDGYTKAPLFVRDWVTIEYNEPILQGNETKDIKIMLKMPVSAEVFSPKWEFWISFKDMSQREMVQMELACRCIVQMK